MKIHGYYFITDAGLSKKGNLNDVAEAVKAGVKVVQYRNKSGHTDEFIDEAAQLRAICKNIIFLVNDNVDTALAVKADGVHIGQDDVSYAEARRALGDEKIIGVTVHNLDEAMKAEMDGADYAGASPIFATATKNDAGEPAGLKLIRDIKKSMKIPVVAIGGITLENAEDVVKAGADALCAISAVITKDDVAGEIEKFQKLFIKQA